MAEELKNIVRKEFDTVAQAIAPGALLNGQWCWTKVDKQLVLKDSLGSTNVLKPDEIDQGKILVSGTDPVAQADYLFDKLASSGVVTLTKEIDPVTFKETVNVDVPDPTTPLAYGQFTLLENFGCESPNTPKPIPLKNEDVKVGVAHASNSDEIEISSDGDYIFSLQAHVAKVITSGSENVALWFEKHDGVSWSVVENSAIERFFDTSNVDIAECKVIIPDLESGDKIRAMLSIVGDITRVILQYIAPNSTFSNSPAIPSFKLIVNKITGIGSLVVSGGDSKNSYPFGRYFNSSIFNGVGIPPSGSWLGDDLTAMPGSSWVILKDGNITEVSFNTDDWGISNTVELHPVINGIQQSSIGQIGTSGKANFSGLSISVSAGDELQWIFQSVTGFGNMRGATLSTEVTNN